MSEHPVKDQIFISKLTGIILANLGNENFGVNELVHEAGISHYSLKRRLLSITNRTIKQFIREVRLQRALEMIQNEELNISEVAYKVGFSSPGYFNTCFHEFFGFPPGAVKKGDYVKTAGTDPENISQHQKKRNPGRVFSFFLISVLVLAVFAYLINKVFFNNSSTDTGIYLNSPGKSIAVLPFKNLSDTLANQYFIDGLMEEILTDLARIHELRVISRTSGERYRNNTDKSIPEIARELRVNYIVEGSGQKYGNFYRIRVQLIEGKSDKHLWVNTYEGEIKGTKDIYKVQSQIAQAIAAELKAEITPEEKQLIEKTHTISLTALNFYQKGRDEFVKYWIDSNNKEALSKAEYYYRRALEYDPEYAQAYTGLALIYKNKNIRREYFSENYMDSVLILADIALLFDNKSAEAYVLKGDYYSEKGEKQKALEEYNRAIEINPNSWEAFWGKANLSIYDDNVDLIYNCSKAASLIQGPERQLILQTLSFLYVQLGFIEIASKSYSEILELYGDSLSYLINLGGLEYSRGNYSKSVEYLEAAYKMDSTRILLFFNQNVFSALGENNLLSGHFEASIKYYRKLISILDTRGEINYNNMHRIGYAYLKNGYKKEADFYFNKQLYYCNVIIKSDRSPKNYAYYDRAGVFAIKGDREKAFEDLKMFNKSKTEGLWMVNLIKSDPLFDSIRNEPEFQQIIRDVEAKYQAEHERIRKWLKDQEIL
jgi:TolB-like protein/AraC-like DNA-binding protein